MLEHHEVVPVKPQRVLILGAAGFVARDLARYLSAQGIEHRAIGSAEIDLLRPESVAQLERGIRADDALVITSAITPEKGKDVATLMSNLTMVEHIVAAMERARPAHVIYISSDAVYDWRENPVRETSVREAADLYGLMHIAREQMLTFAAAKSRVPLCLFCPCAVYGSGDTHNSYGPNRFLGSALKDRTITLFGHGEETRDHVYIEDISRLLALCLLHRSAGILNAASGNAVPFHQVATYVADIVGDDIQIQKRPRNGPVTHRHFDVTERIKAFPRFVPTHLRDGLRAAFLRLTETERD